MRNELRWKHFPYGWWKCEDGREILFNRSYKPIWQRCPGQDPERADSNEWVKWVERRWFYGSAQRTEAEMVEAGEAALAAWGLPIPTKDDLRFVR